MESTEDRSKPIADWARHSLTHDQLVAVFAAHVVEYMDLKTLLLDVMKTAESQGELIRQLAGDVKSAGLKAKLLTRIADSEKHLRRFVEVGAALAKQTAAEAASVRAKEAADALHDKPGGSRDKAAELRSLWATGNYASRTKCVEAECGAGAVDMSIATGIKVLRNTPDPDPWPAKRPVGRPRKP